MTDIIEYKHKRACHPGEYVQEVIRDMGITQEEFAFRMGVSGKCVSELLNRKCRITPELAGKLSAMTGLESEVWMNLQAVYDSRILEIKAEIDLDRQKEVLASLDLGYFLKLTGHKAIKDARDRIAYLCSLFGIASLETLKNELNGCSFRASTPKRNEVNDICARAWLYFAWKKAAEASVDAPFDAEKLESSIREIRGLSLYGVYGSLTRLTKIFNECGVAFVPLPQLRNSKINGVVKWFSGNRKVLLAINDRMKTEDSFWFTLFHEIKHVLQRKYRTVIVSLDEAPEQMRELEAEADDFARETLLPTSRYSQFVSTGDFSYGSIRKLADSEGIHPGIVAARLARDRHVDFRRIAKLRSSFSLSCQAASSCASGRNAKA
jgi:addiction module HigA family antidote